MAHVAAEGSGMMPGSRALALARLLFGNNACARVFEPLVADWQREWQAAQTGRERARVVLRGGAAFAIAVASYALSGGIAMPRHALIRATAVLLISTGLLLASQMALIVALQRTAFPLEMRLWMALPLVLPYAIPVALLVVMLQLRSARAITARAAAATVVAAAVATVVTTGWLTPLMQGDVRDELYEAIHQRAVANDQAGRLTYPGTAVRQLRNQTPEQRAEGYRRFKQSPHYLAAQAELTRPRWNAATFMMGGLAVALGALGWAIGGLRTISVSSAAGWWLLTCVTLLVIDGRFRYPETLTRFFGRAPYWLPLVVFATAALTALIYSSYQERTTRRVP